MIGQREIDGLPALTLASAAEGGLEAAFVPGAGMVCCSLRHGGDELLGQRSGLAAYARDAATMGIPLLYPWANRLGAERFALLGREVVLDERAPRLHRDPQGLPIHGLLGGDPRWRVDRHAALADGGVIAAQFAFADDEALLRAFPFPHRVELEARLDGRTLTITTTIDASHGSPVPVAFGWHPYFALPGTDRHDWQIEVPATEQLRLDQRMLPTGERFAAHIAPGPLGARTFDDGYVAPPPGTPIAVFDERRRIEIAFGEGYPYLQVYAPRDADLIALEPMTAPTNALVDGGAALPVVAPGTRSSAAFSIEITRTG